MNIEKYWHDLDLRLEKLLENGFVKLPSLNEFDLDHIAKDISEEMGSLTFKELGACHKNLLDELEIDKYLAPKLYNIAKEAFNFKGDISNQYHIARKVEPGNSKKCLELILIPIFLQLYYLLKSLHPQITELQEI